MLPSLPKFYASPGVLKQPERLLKLQGGSSAPRAQGRKTHAKDIFNQISWRGPEGGGGEPHGRRRKRSSFGSAC